jgi:hypothetical protein
MARSRKRAGHPYRKPSDIPASQRTSGKIVWSILTACFAILMSWFLSESIFALVIAGVSGAVLGYYIGKKLELEARK